MSSRKRKPWERDKDEEVEDLAETFKGVSEANV